MPLLKKIDIYILRRYLGTFFFMTILLAMMAMVIDFSEKVNDFLEEGGPTLSETLLDYYLNYIPFIISLLFPLCALVSVIFFTSKMASQSEIIAMTGNGINFYRILVPYLLGAFFIAGIHYIGNHYIFPRSNKTRVAFENKYIWKHNYEGSSDNLHFFLDSHHELYIQYFNRRDSSGRNVSLMTYDTSLVLRPQTLTAQRIELIEAPNRWRLSNYRVHEIDGMRERIKEGNQIDTTLNVKISDIVRRDNYKETMTTNELDEFIANVRARGASVSMAFEVERYRRTAYPFSIIILTLIGVSVASRKMRGGMGWHLVQGMILSALYIFMLQFSTTFSTNAGFSPMLGAWTPNIVFLFVALFLLFRAQK